MALDATIGGPSADSYVTLAESDAYHLALGRETTWVDLDADVKEPALRKATIFLNSRYTWRGARVTSTQALAWPRAGIVLDGVSVSTLALPVPLKSACCELALKALTSDLLTDTDAQYVESVTVGPITRKMSARGNGGQKRYAAVDALLRELVRGGSGVVEVVRA